MDPEPQNYLAGSAVLAWLQRHRAFVTSRITHAWRAVKDSLWARKCLRTLQASPLRVGGLIVMTAVVTNMGLLWVMGKVSTLLDFCLRGLLLALGLAGVMTASDWASVKQGSWVIRRLSVPRSGRSATATRISVSRRFR